MPKKTDYKKITVTLHPIQHEQLDIIANETNSTYSEIVRAALNQYLSTHGENNG